MRTSRRILWSFERALTTPGWRYWTVCYHPLVVRSWPRQPAADTPVASQRFDA